MFKYLFALVGLFAGSQAFAQSVTISGQVSDKETKETIPFVTVTCDTAVTVTDEDGNFSFAVNPNSTHTLSIDYADYVGVSIPVRVGSTSVTQTVQLESVASTALDEAVVTAEIGKVRETPVAISNIDAKKIQEELGTRDLPMILNSTPGVYATESGGGVGDSRISMRGFDGENVAVMVDGLPVNDMENGAVYWSNWDGLGDITRQMQVQRGLGASKLSLVAVGGTVNILTKGIDQKRSASIKQEVNSFGLYKTSLSYNTGQLKGRWGIALAGSRKWGQSYADGTFDDAWSYFFKIQKRFNKHLFSLSANGAPQRHGQRSTRLPIAVYSDKLAKQVGIDSYRQLDSIYSTGASVNFYTTPTIGARGIKYNPDFGYINGEIQNTIVNFYHKPLANLTHSWTPNNRMNLTTIAYASWGMGGGTNLKNTSVPRDTVTGQSNLQAIYDANTTNLSPFYSPTEHPASNYIRASRNEHRWYGVLSTFNLNITENLQGLFGVDLRYYKGLHYQTVENLLGGDYAIESKPTGTSTNGNWNQPNGIENLSYAMKRVGDTVAYNYVGKVKWGGLFTQFEYKRKKWSTFITGSVNAQGLQRLDYFKRRDLVLADTTIHQAVGYGDTLTYNGVEYTNTSKEARVATTDVKWFLGWTTKLGANYKISQKHNVFANAGYLSIPQRINNVFNNSNQEYLNIKNQLIQSVELGYGFRTGKISVNVNAYYTIWQNKPSYTTVQDPTSGQTLYVNINGIDELHKGIEGDLTYRPTKKLTFELIGALCDWKYTSGSTAYIFNTDGTLVDTFDFGAVGVHVGNSPQIQLGGSVRYEIVKNLWVKARGTYFAKNYSNFRATDLQGINKNRDSWQMPNYFILDANVGYDIDIKKTTLTITGGVFNVLNTIYITDASNGANFDAYTATVYVAMGTRANLGLKLTF